jgi:two-component system nitrate/nitrite response regulator NarL
VLVADAVAMSCRLLADALHRTKRYEAVSAVTRKDTFDALQSKAFDVIVISMNFPNDPFGGLGVLREVCEQHTRVSAIAMLDALERSWVVEAFRCGARGVFWRADSFPTLCKCIQCVHEGQVWASARELRYVVEALATPLINKEQPLSNGRALSKREEEIARLVAEGMSNRQISQQLALSEHTIKNYLFRIFEKIGVSTRVELALYALNRGPARRPMLRAVKPRAHRPALNPEN